MKGGDMAGDDMHLIVECLECGYSCNPYASMSFFGMSYEAVFNRLPHCPECGEHHWTWYQH